jgi:hypothetical protein
MEAKMAHVVHHHHGEKHHVETFGVWAAGIFLALLAFILIYFSMTNATGLAPVSPPLPEPPAVPIFWWM